MAGVTLKPMPLTRERFEPFGDVIETARDRRQSMNEARFDRFDDLADVDVDAAVAISIARSRTATSLPYRFDVVADRRSSDDAPTGSTRATPLLGTHPTSAAPRTRDMADTYRSQWFTADRSSSPPAPVRR